MHNSDVEDVLFSIRRLVADKPDSAPRDASDHQAEDGQTDPQAEKDGALFLTSSLRVGEGLVDLSAARSDAPATFSTRQDRKKNGETDANAMGHGGSATTERSNLTPEGPEQTGHVRASEAIIAHEDIEEVVEQISKPRVYTGEPEGDAPVALDVPQSPIRPETDVTELWSLAVDADPIISEISEPVEVRQEAPSTSPHSDENAEEGNAPAVFVPKARSAKREPSTASTPALAHGKDDSVNLADLNETSQIDEDIIRDIVTQVVREELSGVVGERITRNIRKLVRREIHRAMVARDFE